MERSRTSACRIHHSDLIGEGITSTGNSKEEDQGWAWEGTMGTVRYGHCMWAGLEWGWKEREQVNRVHKQP